MQFATIVALFAAPAVARPLRPAAVASPPVPIFKVTEFVATCEQNVGDFCHYSMNVTPINGPHAVPPVTTCRADANNAAGLDLGGKLLPFQDKQCNSLGIYISLERNGETLTLSAYQELWEERPSFPFNGMTRLPFQVGRHAIGPGDLKLDPAGVQSYVGPQEFTLYVPFY